VRLASPAASAPAPALPRKGRAIARSVFAALAAAAAVGSLAVLADDDAKATGRPGASDAAKRQSEAWDAIPLPVREEEALAFVRQHYPQLATLVEQLKPMRPDEYEKAINDLYQVSRSLAGMKTRDPRRYDVALETWKAKSKVQVLAARLASAPSAELEAQLRAALGKQVDAQLSSMKLERESLQARVRKLDEQIDRQEKNREQTIETRFQGLVKKGQRVRRRDGGNAAPAGASGAPRKTEP
jgi:hypothetical protein